MSSVTGKLSSVADVTDKDGLKIWVTGSDGLKTEETCGKRQNKGSPCERRERVFWEKRSPVP